MHPGPFGADATFNEPDPSQRRRHNPRSHTLASPLKHPTQPLNQSATHQASRHPVHQQAPLRASLTLRGAADAFLDALGNPHTVRNYGIGVGKIAARLGEGRPLAAVANDEIGEALEALWGSSAVNTLERPPRRGGLVAVVVHRARLRRPGGAGLGEAAGGAGL